MQKTKMWSDKMFIKVMEAMKEMKLDAILLTHPVNIQYVSGFTGEGVLFLSNERRAVITDFRYLISAERECESFEVIDAKGKPYEKLIDLLSKDISSIGFESDTMTVADYHKWQKANNHVKWISTEGIVGKIRSIKTKIEIDRIKKAVDIGDESFHRILKVIKPAMTEKQIALQLEFIMRELGADGISFNPIVASGIHASMPHAIPTEKPIEKNDFLILDFGCKVNGYCSDMTRTIVIGRASEEQRKYYHLVLKAGQTALQGIRPGLQGREVDAMARNVIEEAGCGHMFGHGLGHSVGLEIHEKPCFSTRDENIILPGMVITVEPGIYDEKFGGVRIEDLIVVTENGCDNLTHSSKELIEL